MVAETPARPSHISGDIELRSTPEPVGDSAIISSPLVGYTLARLEAFGKLSLAYPASSRAQDRPGVQAVYNSRTTHLSFVLGNAFDGKGVTTDAGVILDVYTLDSGRARGRWHDGGTLRTPPYGYFCITRG
jgi:hypothetical protein